MSMKTVVAAVAAVSLATILLGASAGAATFKEETPFSQSAFANAQKAGDPILVHITAPWCTVCSAQKPIVDKLHAEPQFRNMKIFNVDFDSQKSLVHQLGARMQSTLIVYKGATEEGRSSGETKPDNIKALLEKAE